MRSSLIRVCTVCLHLSVPIFKIITVIVLNGSKDSRTVSVEARYDGQSLQEAKIGGLVYTL